MRLQHMNRPFISLLTLFSAFGGCASLSSTGEKGEEENH